MLRIICRYLGSLLNAMLVVGILLGTEKGNEILIRWALNLSPIYLTIEKISGSLFSTLTLKNIHFKSSTQDFTLDDLIFTWQPLHWIDTHELIINKITAHKKDAFLVASYRLAPSQEMQAQWNIQIPHLNSILPPGQGEMASRGQLVGKSSKIKIQAFVSGNALSFAFEENYFTAKKIHGNLNLDFSSLGKMNVDLHMKHVSIGENKLSEIKLLGFGTLTNHQITLNARESKRNLHLTLMGGWFQDEWRGNINSLNLRIPPISWRSLKPVPIVISAQRFLQSGPLCWQQKNSQLCVIAAWEDKKNWSIVLNSPFLDIDALQKLFVSDPMLLNIKLKNTRIAVEGTQQGRMKLDAHTVSGNGELKIAGDGEIENDKKNFNLIISGNNVLVSNTPRYKINITPHLKIEIKDNLLTTTGELYIPTAELNLGNGTGEAVDLSSDVRFVHDKPSSPPFVLQSNIKLRLGNNIKLQYAGLTGNLTGELIIVDTPNSLTLGTGRLVLENATYAAYGDSLRISKGELLFNGGPVNNPGIDVEASKLIKNVSSMPTATSENIMGNATNLVGGENQVTVGVKIQGTLLDRRVSLFSEPPGLSQADILSYLILGQPASEISATDAQLLLRAASAMNSGGNSGGGVGQIQQQLQHIFGLSELTVGTANYGYGSSASSTQNNTSLILGKALSSRLYINYSMGLLQQVNILKLRYLIGKNWVWQTNTSTLGSGTDIFYTFNPK